MLARCGVFLSLGILGSAFAAGCGGADGDLTTDTGGTSSTGGATGGGSATGGTSGATGGSNGTPIDPPTALPATTCTSEQVIYQGTMGGAPIDETLTLASSPVGLFSAVGYDKGLEALDITETLEGDTFRIRGALVMPAGSAKAGEVWCIDNGLRSGQTNAPYSYTGHSLGKCPGTPTGQTVYACTDYSTEYCDPSELEGQELGGTLNGKEIDVGTGGGALQSSGTVHVKSRTNYRIVFFADDSAPANGSTPVTGYIVGVEDGPHDGEVYCVDGGTWSTNADFTWDTFVLDQVSYLGSCNDGVATEKLEGCFGY